MRINNRYKGIGLLSLGFLLFVLATGSFSLRVLVALGALFLINRGLVLLGSPSLRMFINSWRNF